jgi:hypothetical protein
MLCRGYRLYTLRVDRGAAGRRWRKEEARDHGPEAAPPSAAFGTTCLAAEGAHASATAPQCRRDAVSTRRDDDAPQ